MKPRSQSLLIRMMRGWIGVAALAVTGCGEAPPTTPKASEARGRDTFAVMSYNVGAYGYADRTGNGQADNLKSEEERRAVQALILSARPDILALQEMGNPQVFEEFRRDLASAGLEYPFHDLLQRDQSEQNLAVLSRFPITSSFHHLDDRFSIGDASVPVKRGYLEVDISINPNYQLRLINAQLKSKTYHRLGHTEMRRNEARLLNNHVRRALGRQHRLNLLVVGDMNDHVRAAPLRMLMGNREEYLIDLKPTDPFGELWTYFDAESEQYHRYDYLLASPYMQPEYIASASEVVRHPEGKLASSHRPLLAVFHARDIEPANTLMLPSYEYDE